MPYSFLSNLDVGDQWKTPGARAEEDEEEGIQLGSGTTARLCLSAVNTGLRPDEAWRLEVRDVTVADDEDLGKTILEIEVRGKHGVRYCKSMPGAVRP